MVILVGTSHSIQMGIDDASCEAGKKLKAFLEGLCKTYAIRGVAEEMSAEALAEKSCSTSVPRQLAASLNLEHRFCDPNRSQRVVLKISQENDIRARATFSAWSEADIAERVVESHAKRERYWLDQLRAFNRWPVLFVCGADHVDSFRSLLEQEGIAVHVAATDWAPNNSVERDVPRRRVMGSNLWLVEPTLELPDRPGKLGLDSNQPKI